MNTKGTRDGNGNKAAIEEGIGEGIKSRLLKQEKKRYRMRNTNVTNQNHKRKSGN